MKIKVFGASTYGFASKTDYEVNGSWAIDTDGVLNIYGPMDDKGTRRCVAAHAAGQWSSVVNEEGVSENADRMACEWSDYRKEYGTLDLNSEHHAFTSGWKAALGESLEPGVLR